MPRKLTKGELTRERILLVAKERFYKNGYNTTTIQEIATISDTTLGSMTYHFPTKDTFINAIFEDYLKSITSTVNQYLFHLPPVNAFKHHYFVTLVWYHHLLTDLKVKRFYYEISKNDLFYRSLHHSISKIYHQFSEDYNLRIRPVEFDALLIADFGARRELTINYCEGKIKMPIEDYSILLLSNTARCFGIPQKEIYKVSYEALLFFRKYSFDDIKLLI